MNLNKNLKNQMPTNFKFGIFFSFIFIASASYFYWVGLIKISYFTTFIATLLLIISFTAAHLLNFLNHLWFKLGIILGRVFSPIVLGLIFFVLITPLSLITRLFGRDELRLKYSSDKSYWKNYTQRDIDPNSFRNQY